MLDRLQIVKQRFDEISDLIIQPDIIADQKRYVQLNQEYKTLKALAGKRDEYVSLMSNIILPIISCIIYFFRSIHQLVVLYVKKHLLLIHHIFHFVGGYYVLYPLEVNIMF